MAIKLEFNRNFINRLKQLKTYPFNLLIYLEWILLGSAILGELPENFLLAIYPQPSKQILLSSSLSFISLIGLGLMGLVLPKKQRLHKWLYVAIQLSLIALLIIVNQPVTPLLTPFLIVVMRNCLIFKSKECWLANTLVFISFIPSLGFIGSFADFKVWLSQYQAISVKEFETLRNISNVSYLFLNALLIAFICILVNALLREHKSQKQLAQAREKLRQYALQAEDRATVQERNRIAREIHDSVGHALTAQTIQLNNIIAFWQVDPDKAYQFVLETKQLAATALQEIRYSVSTLRSDPLEGKNLDSAIALLFQEFSNRTQIVPDYTVALNHDITEEIKLTVYRIVQEALTNIAKHSKAQNVKVNLQTFPEHLHLSIKDDGKGFNPELNTTGFGLQGMQERITSLNGKFEIYSKLNSGCKIAIYIPYLTLLIDN